MTDKVYDKETVATNHHPWDPGWTAVSRGRGAEYGGKIGDPEESFLPLKQTNVKLSTLNKCT